MRPQFVQIASPALSFISISVHPQLGHFDIMPQRQLRPVQ
jgi:hypothetical protein